MAGTTITVSALAATEGFGSATIGPFTVTGVNTPLVEAVTLASGDTTVAVPAGSFGFVLAPSSANTAALKLKGASGDTGVSLPKASESIYFFDPTSLPANVIINAASAAGVAEIVFF